MKQDAALAAKELERAERLLEQRSLAEAREAFQHAESLGAHPDRCSGGRWSEAMLRGDFAGAWAESDAIRRRGEPDPHRLWDGSDLRGKRVVVRCLRGFGDAVQMLRLLPRLRELTGPHGRVQLEVAPDLVELARCFDGAAEVFTWGDDAPAVPPEWDVQIELMELPYLLRLKPEQLPVACGYIRLPDQVRHAASRRMGVKTRPRIGIGSCASDWDTRRSLTTAQLEPLLDVAGLEFWCLDRSCGFRDDARLRNVRDVVGDGLLRLAAAIANLDLVITVDTLAAHLAGALGKPVWTMLQYAADWRWQVHRDDSPWYPTMRLFRQPQPGDWLPVVQQVQAALVALKS